MGVVVNEGGQCEMGRAMRERVEDEGDGGQCERGWAMRDREGDEREVLNVR